MAIVDPTLEFARRAQQGMRSPAVTTLADALNRTRPLGSSYTPAASQSGLALAQLKTDARLGFQDAERRRQAALIASGKQPDADPGGIKGFLADVLDSVPAKIILKPLEIIDLPRRAILSTIQETGDLLEGKGFSFSDWKDQVGDATFGFGDVIGDFTDNKYVNRLLGFIGDVAFDPTTYVTLGMSKFAGAAGRIALAEQVLTKTSDNVLAQQVARYGRAALSNKQITDLGIAGLKSRGMYFMGKKIGKNGWVGKASEELGSMSEKAINRLRFAADDFRITRFLHTAFTPEVHKEARLALLRGQIPQDVAGDVIRVLNSRNLQRSAEGQALTLAQRNLAQAITESNMTTNVNLRRRITGILEGTIADGTPEELAVAARVKALKGGWYNEVQARFLAVDPDAQLGFVENHVPWVTSDDAKRHLDDATSRWQGEIQKGFGDGDLLSMFSPRWLVSKINRDGSTKWFGTTLTREDLPKLSIDFLNDLARKGGADFDVFETDIVKIMNKYSHQYAQQMGLAAKYEELAKTGALSRAEMLGDDVMYDEKAAKKLGSEVQKRHKGMVAAAHDLDRTINDTRKAVGDIGNILDERLRKAQSLNPQMDAWSKTVALNGVVSDMLAPIKERLRVLKDAADFFGDVFTDDVPLLQKQIRGAIQQLEDDLDEVFGRMTSKFDELTGVEDLRAVALQSAQELSDFVASRQRYISQIVDDMETATRYGHLIESRWAQIEAGETFARTEGFSGDHAEYLNALVASTRGNIGGTQTAKADVLKKYAGQIRRGQKFTPNSVAVKKGEITAAEAQLVNTFIDQFSLNRELFQERGLLSRVIAGETFGQGQGLTAEEAAALNKFSRALNLKTGDTPVRSAVRGRFKDYIESVNGLADEAWVPQAQGALPISLNKLSRLTAKDIKLILDRASVAGAESLNDLRTAAMWMLAQDYHVYGRQVPEFLREHFDSLVKQMGDASSAQWRYQTVSELMTGRQGARRRFAEVGSEAIPQIKVVEKAQRLNLTDKAIVAGWESGVWDADAAARAIGLGSNWRAAMSRSRSTGEWTDLTRAMVDAEKRGREGIEKFLASGRRLTDKAAADEAAYRKAFQARTGRLPKRVKPFKGGEPDPGSIEAAAKAAIYNDQEGARRVVETARNRMSQREKKIYQVNLPDGQRRGTLSDFLDSKGKLNIPSSRSLSAQGRKAGSGFIDPNLETAALYVSDDEFIGTLNSLMEIEQARDEWLTLRAFIAGYKKGQWDLTEAEYAIGRVADTDSAWQASVAQQNALSNAAERGRVLLHTINRRAREQGINVDAALREELRAAGHKLKRLSNQEFSVTLPSANTRSGKLLSFLEEGYGGGIAGLPSSEEFRGVMKEVADQAGPRQISEAFDADVYAKKLLHALESYRVMSTYHVRWQRLVNEAAALGFVPSEDMGKRVFDSVAKSSQQRWSRHLSVNLHADELATRVYNRWLEIVDASSRVDAKGAPVKAATSNFEPRIKEIESQLVVLETYRPSERVFRDRELRFAAAQREGTDSLGFTPDQWAEWIASDTRFRIENALRDLPQEGIDVSGININMTWQEFDEAINRIVADKQSLVQGLKNAAASPAGLGNQIGASARRSSMTNYGEALTQAWREIAESASLDDTMHAAGMEILERLSIRYGEPRGMIDRMTPNYWQRKFPYARSDDPKKLPEVIEKSIQDVYQNEVLPWMKRYYPEHVGFDKAKKKIRQLAKGGDRRSVFHADAKRSDIEMFFTALRGGEVPVARFELQTMKTRFGRVIQQSRTNGLDQTKAASFRKVNGLIKDEADNAMALMRTYQLAMDPSASFETVMRMLATASAGSERMWTPMTFADTLDAIGEGLGKQAAEIKQIFDEAQTAWDLLFAGREIATAVDEVVQGVVKGTYAGPVLPDAVVQLEPKDLGKVIGELRKRLKGQRGVKGTKELESAIAALTKFHAIMGADPNLVATEREIFRTVGAPKGNARQLIGQDEGTISKALERANKMRASDAYVVAAEAQERQRVLDRLAAYDGWRAGYETYIPASTAQVENKAGELVDIPQQYVTNGGSMSKDGTIRGWLSDMPRSNMDAVNYQGAKVSVDDYDRSNVARVVFNVKGLPDLTFTRGEWEILFVTDDFVENATKDFRSRLAKMYNERRALQAKAEQIQKGLRVLEGQGRDMVDKGLLTADEVPAWVQMQRNAKWQSVIDDTNDAIETLNGEIASLQRHAQTWGQYETPQARRALRRSAEQKLQMLMDHPEVLTDEALARTFRRGAADEGVAAGRREMLKNTWEASKHYKYLADVNAAEEAASKSALGELLKSRENLIAYLTKVKQKAAALRSKPLGPGRGTARVGAEDVFAAEFEQLRAHIDGLDRALTTTLDETEGAFAWSRLSPEQIVQLRDATVEDIAALRRGAEEMAAAVARGEEFDIEPIVDTFNLMVNRVRLTTPDPLPNELTGWRVPLQAAAEGLPSPTERIGAARAEIGGALQGQAAWVEGSPLNTAGRLGQQGDEIKAAIASASAERQQIIGDLELLRGLFDENVDITEGWPDLFKGTVAKGPSTSYVGKMRVDPTSKSRKTMKGAFKVESIDDIFEMFDSTLAGINNDLLSTQQKIENMASTIQSLTDEVANMPAFNAQSTLGKGNAPTAVQEEIMHDFGSWAKNALMTLGAVNDPDLGPIYGQLMAVVEAEARFVGSKQMYTMTLDQQKVMAQQAAKSAAQEAAAAAKKAAGIHMVSLKDLGLPGMQARKEIADMLSKMARMEDPRFAKLVNGLIGKYTKFFRGYATLSPGFHLRNAISNVTMLIAAGSDPVNLTTGFRVWTSMKRALEQNLNFEQWLKTVPEQYRYAADIASKAAHGMGGGQTSDLLNDLVREGQKKLMNNKALRFSQKIGSNVEGSARFMLAFDSAMEGMDLNGAMARIRRYLFDYQDISAADRNIKAIVPFWTWMSRNLPLQLINMWTNPRLYSVYASMVRNISDGNEDGVVPPWLAVSGAVPIGGDNYLNLDLGWNKIEETVGQIEDPMKLLANLNPGLRVPMEVLGGTQFFTGNRFSETPQPAAGGFAAPALESLAGLLGMAQTAGPGSDLAGQTVVDPRFNYMMTNLIPPLGQANRLFPSTDYGREKSLNSWLGYLGIPVTQVTEGMKTAEIARRQRELDALAQSAERLGYTP